MAQAGRKKEDRKSETKDQRDALRTSETRYRRLFETAKDGILILDAHSGLITDVNPFLIQLLDYTREELIGQTLWDIGAFRQIQASKDAFKELQKKEYVRFEDLPLETKGGRRINVEFVGNVYEENGKSVIQCNIRDITARKRADEARERLIAAIESSDDAIIGKALDGTITSWNAGAEKIFGYSAVEAVGRPLMIIVPSERASEEADILLRIRQGERVCHFETVRVRKDGSRIDVVVTICPVRNGSGAIVGVSKIARDITSRNHAERLLRNSQENYRRLFESMDEGFCTIEVMFDENNKAVDYRFLEVNPAFVKQTGIENAPGKSMRESFPQLEEYWFTTYGEIALTGEPARFQYWAEHWHCWYDVHAFRVGEPQERKVAVFFEDITERKRVEVALRESEARFHAFMDNVPALAWAKDEQGRYAYLNRAYEDCFGVRLEDWNGKTDFEVWPAETASAFRKADQSVIATGKVLEVAEKTVVSGNRYRTWQSIKFPFRDATGRKFVGGIGVEITKKQIVEEQLREYERVVEGLEEMILVVDRNYRYVIANRAFLNFRGMSAGEVVGQSAENLVGKDVFAALVRAKMDECFSGQPVHYEMSYDFPNLGLRDLSVSYLPIEGAEGVERIACVLQDITKRKLAELALLQSEERFSKAFRHSPLPITISTELEGCFLDVNDAFLDLLGYRREDVIGHTAAELRFWGDPLDRVEMLLQLKEGERVSKHQMQYRTAKGETREAEVWVESIELDGQPCLLGIIRDVTEIRQLEAQFRQAQKMEAVGRLAGGVAHDFNNILSIIMGYSDLSLDLIAPESPVRRYVAETKSAAKRAALLTQQLLAFSRQQIVFPKILNLNEVVQNVNSMFLRLVGDDIEIEFHAGKAIGSIKADSGQIEQVLMNLVVNARDAMPAGGKIVIETKQVELDEYFVTLHPGTGVGKYVALHVSDTGCGMDALTKSQIFEPFFTTKPMGKGTGLGLSTVYGIVKQYDGHISVYSEPDQGTMFKVYFPAAGEPVEAIGTLPEEEPPRGSETILVVEDDKTLRELAVKLLLDGGYRVVEASDAEHALKIVVASEPEIDLLLTDVVMLGMSGVELVKQAEAGHPKLRSLFMSGYAGGLVGRQGVQIQENSFLEKPFSRRSLLTKVHAVLHRASTTSPAA